jgi:RNA:NAD 2'-phosphotransferase (TPT1/KptA family)
MVKDEAAAALAAKRWKKTTKAQRSEVAQTMNRSRWANATPEQRAAQGQRLAAARAKKKAGPVKKTATKKDK